MKRQNVCAEETVDASRYFVYEAGRGLVFKSINPNNQIFQKIGQIHTWCIARNRFTSDAKNLDFLHFRLRAAITPLVFQHATGQALVER